MQLQLQTLAGTKVVIMYIEVVEAVYN